MGKGLPPGPSTTQRPPQTPNKSPVCSSEILLRLGTGRFGSSTRKDYRHAEAQLIGTLNKPTRNFWKPTSQGQDLPLRSSLRRSKTPARRSDLRPDEQSGTEEYTPTRHGDREGASSGRRNGSGKGRKSRNSQNRDPKDSSDSSDDDTDSRTESDSEEEDNDVIDRRQRKTKPKSPYRKRYLVRSLQLSSKISSFTQHSGPESCPKGYQEGNRHRSCHGCRHDSGS